MAGPQSNGTPDPAYRAMRDRILHSPGPESESLKNPFEPVKEISNVLSA